MKVNKEQAEKIQELQKDSRESLKEENTKLMERVAKLAEETSKLKEELTDLSRQLSAQGRQLSALEQRLSALRMVERVLLQKLCEAAREKCVRLAREADVEIPLAADGKTNWNAFYNIPDRGIVKRCSAHRGARICQIDPAAFACRCASSGGVGGGVPGHSAGADAQRVPDQNGEHSGVRLASSSRFSPSGL
ncbi:uncharacterized protein LOC9647425 [Selaginella moellendorffii]|uniref:uncharacterized protein LOC9647425 n=1 Tax=Selaginella moellendorffii TaxID=88036 RepID=UPI000D1C303B|nr:uncharacterized protein LOC9647425 [Selaginella moellendorffii]XP_024542174.1 uncharacterized protein LOC9647425 [Selaginella moellendorffii]|eukprot:XP_024542173.1 uncharacterized protein LOC9647425 [Selaginella moellendorffii]